MSKVVMISSDCHAGALPEGYKPYMPKEFHSAADIWWLQYAREMMKRMGTFFDQEAAQEFNSRSGDQFDIWEAVYSPIGPDGYPRRVWDKVSGEIDPVTVAYWRENYDLSYILRRDWKTLGPKLRGKLRIYVGDMDNYYLNNAVYEVEKFLRQADPPSDAVVDYGDRDEHCWNGDHSRSNAYSRLRYHQMFIPRIMEQIRKNHPKDVDTLSWRY